MQENNIFGNNSAKHHRTEKKKRVPNLLKGTIHFEKQGLSLMCYTTESWYYNSTNVYCNIFDPYITGQ